MSIGLDTFWKIGANLWEETYKLKTDDNFAMNVLGEKLWRANCPGTVKPYGWSPDINAWGLMHSAAKWVHGGCPVFAPDPKSFAAFAFSTINSDSLKDIRVPWPSFGMKFPPLTSGDGQVYSFACFSNFERVDMVHKETKEPFKGCIARMDVISDNGEYALHKSIPDKSVILADLFSVGDDEISPDAVLNVEKADGDLGLSRMVLNACFGCLYTMQHTNNWRQSTSRAGRRSPLRHLPPPHRNIIVGSPIKIDLMPTVKAVASGAVHKSPSFQTLARGHYKRQVIGVGRSGRKVIWIEPYWRGPEEAPILSHVYRVGVENG